MTGGRAKVNVRVVLAALAFRRVSSVPRKGPFNQNGHLRSWPTSRRAGTQGGAGEQMVNVHIRRRQLVDAKRGGCHDRRVMDLHGGNGRHLQLDGGRRPGNDRLTGRRLTNGEYATSAWERAVVGLLRPNLVRAGGNAAEAGPAIGARGHHTQPGYVDRYGGDARPD